MYHQLFFTNLFNILTNQPAKALEQTCRKSTVQPWVVVTPRTLSYIALLQTVQHSLMCIGYGCFANLPTDFFANGVYHINSADGSCES